MHRDLNDLLHEMIIVIDKNSYIRPHKHLWKSESFHLIYGEADIVIFNDYGEIVNIIELALNKLNKLCELNQ